MRPRVDKCLAHGPARDPFSHVERIIVASPTRAVGLQIFPNAHVKNPSLKWLAVPWGSTATPVDSASEACTFVGCAVPRHLQWYCGISIEYRISDSQDRSSVSCVTYRGVEPIQPRLTHQGYANSSRHIGRVDYLWDFRIAKGVRWSLLDRILNRLIARHKVVVSHSVPVGMLVHGFHVIRATSSRPRVTADVIIQ